MKKRSLATLGTVQARNSTAVSGSGMSQFIYIATTPSLSGVVKIGRVDTAPDETLVEIETNGSKKTFYLEFSVEVEYASIMESKVQIALSKYRFSAEWSLFRISVKKAVETVLSIIEDCIIHKFQNDHGIERLQIEAARRAAVLSAKNKNHLEMLKVPFEVNLVAESLDAEKNKQNGFIYLASTPAMPGIVKLGNATIAPDNKFTGFIAEAAESTFFLELSVEVELASFNESRAQVALSKFRCDDKRGFFRISVTEAIKTMLSVIEGWTLHEYRKDPAIILLIERLDLVKRTSKTHQSSTNVTKSTSYGNGENLDRSNQVTNRIPPTDLPISSPNQVQRHPRMPEASQFIYIISNPSMPGYVKVGRTNTTLQQRLSELHSTGVPTPFVLELGIEVNNSAECERKAHEVLSKFRGEKNREFFKVSVKKAIEIVLAVIDDYKIDSFRDHHGIEMLLHDLDLRNSEARTQRRQKAVRIKSELTQLNQDKAIMEQRLARERDIYKSLGSYPKNRFGDLFFISTLLFPAFFIFASLSENSEQNIFILIVAYVIGFAANQSFDKDIGDRESPFLKSQREIDKLQSEIGQIQRRAKEYEVILKDLGENN